MGKKQQQTYFSDVLELIGVSLNASEKASTLSTGLCFRNNYLLITSEMLSTIP